MALLSLSTGDYSCLGPLLGALMDRFAQEKVSVSMPSMRVGTLTPEVMEQIRRVRKTGFTLAPEAGSERLRLAINKGISEEDLLATCRQAAALGWRQIKLYFMFGLPTETEEDMEAIVTPGRQGGAECRPKLYHCRECRHLCPETAYPVSASWSARYRRGLPSGLIS